MTLGDGEGYRLAAHVPWDAHYSPDWGRVFDLEKQVIRELMARAKQHTGAGFKVREIQEDWGPKRSLQELDETIDRRINKKFKVGDVLHIWALKDDMRWMIREVQTKPDVMDIKEGNDGVDLNHSLIFGVNGKKRHPNAESWGIFNKRYISGTTTWSQHSPWHEDGCTSNAEDFHAPSLAAMKDIANDIVQNGRASKMLLAGEEWTPQAGWRFVGSYIDHYDHLHCEPLPTRHSLC